jgi:hypothetical protein
MFSSAYWSSRCGEPHTSSSDRCISGGDRWGHCRPSWHYRTDRTDRDDRFGRCPRYSRSDWADWYRTNWADRIGRCGRRYWADRSGRRTDWANRRDRAGRLGGCYRPYGSYWQRWDSGGDGRNRTAWTYRSGGADWFHRFHGSNGQPGDARSHWTNRSGCRTDWACGSAGCRR